MKTKFIFFFFLFATCIAGYAQQFTTPKTAPDVYTMGHDTLGSHNFNLYGAINAHGENAAYAFVYSTDSTFTTSTTSPVQNKVIDTLQIVWATINGLTADTTYYYYLTASTTGGTVNGKHMRFYSDNIPFLFENMGADVYDITYAELNGKVRGFQNNVSLSFEYGLTPALGLTAVSNFPTLSDANSHEFKAYPSPLTHGLLYFFRVKAVSATDTLFTDIKAFYMGNPYTILHASPATNITSSSADLNGSIQGFHVPIKVNSEIYGGTINHFHTPYVYYDVTSSLINYTYNAVNLQENQNYSIRLKVYTWIGSYYDTTSVTTLTTGFEVEANQVDNVFTYPIPANNFLTVEMKSALNSESTIQLFNLNGQLIKELKIPAYQKRTLLDLAGLESGSYLLKLISGNMILNKNVVIIK